MRQCAGKSNRLPSTDPLAQEEFVGKRKQPAVHLFAQFGDEAKPLGDQELLRQGLGQIAIVAKVGAEQ